MKKSFLKTAEAVYTLLSEEHSEEREVTPNDRGKVAVFIKALREKTQPEMASFVSFLNEDDSYEGILHRTRIYNYSGAVFWELERFATEVTHALPPKGDPERDALLAFSEAWLLFAKWQEKAAKQSAAILAATATKNPASREKND